jgi:hypothetical protein
MSKAAMQFDRNINQVMILGHPFPSNPKHKPNLINDNPKDIMTNKAQEIPDHNKNNKNNKTTNNKRQTTSKG